MNASELSVLTGTHEPQGFDQIKQKARALAQKNGRSVFVTLAGGGIIGATAAGEVEQVPALPLRGEIDIVGAGDAVSANLTTALASGATLLEALELANAAASIVIHQLGTTGSANVAQLAGMFEVTSQSP
jgi:bifunctional ADP-heptose synthase (sugar kinase/adenylyltransferase)